MGRRILHDGGLQPTERSIDFFKKHRKKLGRIMQININDGIKYRGMLFYMKIIGTKAIMYLSGCTSGYRGTGPHGTVELLKLAGVNFNEDDIFMKEVVEINC